MRSLVLIALVALLASALLVSAQDAAVAAPAADASVNATRPLVKPAIDVAAALNPATRRSFRTVEPVLTGINIPKDNAPTVGAANLNSSLSIPRIFDAAAAPGAVKDPSEPSVGAPPANFTKAAISKHPFGGHVSYRRAHNRFGCPCKRQVPEKHRYDVSYKPAPVKFSKRCCCRKHKKKPTDGLPPVIPEYRRERKVFNATAPCRRHRRHHKKVAKIAPAYYPHPVKKSKKQLAFEECLKNNGTLPVKPQNVQPAFYPRKRLTRRERRAAKKSKQAGANVVIVPKIA